MDRRNQFILDRRQVLGGMGGALLVGGMPTFAGAQANQLVLSNYGGSQVDNMKIAFTDPFTKDTGIPVVYDTSGPTVGRIRAMLDGGKAVWDLCDSSPGAGIDLGTKGMLEEIDYSIVDEKKLPPGLGNKWAVPSYLFSSIIAFNKKALGGKVPTGWKDFYNLKDFPGKRTLSRIAQSVLETALLADGVPKDKIYPVDVKRGLEKVKTIKDQTLFWRTAAESVEFLRTGEASMGLLWSTRAAILKKETNGECDFIWDQGILMSAAWVMPKGNPGGRTNAMKLIASMQDPERQASLLRSQYSGPVNPAATALLTPEERLLSPGAHADKQMWLDYNWLSENNVPVEQQYIAAIS